jgi:hypothetical protein
MDPRVREDDGLFLNSIPVTPAKAGVTGMLRHKKTALFT